MYGGGVFGDGDFGGFERFDGLIEGVLGDFVFRLVVSKGWRGDIGHGLQ